MSCAPMTPRPGLSSDKAELSAAARIFPNQGMHRNAEFIAALHPRAIDYLSQAPVIAAAFGVKANTRADRLYIAMRVGGPISRGERLRNVMSSIGLALPLRKLTGFAITPRIAGFVRELSEVPSSALSQAIPDKPSDQRRWLSELHTFRRRIAFFGHCGNSNKSGFQWIARHAHRCEEGQAGDIADFLRANPSSHFEGWTLERMVNEVELWHDRLGADRSLERYGIALKPTTIIDLSDWPDHVQTKHFEFFKLSTPSMLMEEGRRMRHCVASYIPKVMNGGTHLYSIRAEMRRVATIEIVGSRIVQAKGFANRRPAQSVLTAAAAFAREHNPLREAA